MRKAILISVLFSLVIWVAGPSYASADEIIVSAAASLTNVMSEISRSFESRNPGITVTCNFASSGSLVGQMANGAPVDVFASASIEHMDRADAKGLIQRRTRKLFAQNRLVLIVPARSTALIKNIRELRASEFKKIAVGHPDAVPAGRYAKIFMEENKLWATLYDRLVYANSVRQVLDYVRRGEVDAGFVYATDAVVAGNSVRVGLRAEKSLNIFYPIAVARKTAHAPSADRFCAFVCGPAGKKVLEAYGFGVPE